MKKHNLLALFCILLLLLCGCSGESGEGKGSMDTLFETTESALERGCFFFAGEVLGVKTDSRLISYYDAQMGENTFYSVRVTKDLYGCMPERNITVCVLGNSETFPDRTTLSKGKEYYFTAELWVEKEETIFLLPTFYKALPELREGGIYSEAEGKSAYCGSEEEYGGRLDALAETTGYSPAVVLQSIKNQLKNATLRDADYFEELEFEKVDAAALKQTASFAATLLQRAQATKETWEGLGELIK